MAWSLSDGKRFAQRLGDVLSGFTQGRYDARFAKIFCHKSAKALSATNGFKNKNPDGGLYIKNILYLLYKLEMIHTNKACEFSGILTRVRLTIKKIKWNYRNIMKRSFQY